MSEWASACVCGGETTDAESGNAESSLRSACVVRWRECVRAWAAEDAGGTHRGDEHRISPFFPERLKSVFLSMLVAVAWIAIAKWQWPDVCLATNWRTVLIWFGMSAGQRNLVVVHEGAWRHRTQGVAHLRANGTSRRHASMGFSVNIFIPNGPH